MYEKLRVTAVLKTPIIIRGFLTFDALMGALHFEKYEDVEKAHANIPIKCNEGLFHASAAQVEDFQRGSISFIAGVIPPFLGLFETRITRPICTGSVS